MSAATFPPMDVDIKKETEESTTSSPVQVLAENANFDAEETVSFSQTIFQTSMPILHNSTIAQFNNPIVTMLDTQQESTTSKNSLRRVVVVQQQRPSTTVTLTPVPPTGLVVFHDQPCSTLLPPPPPLKRFPAVGQTEPLSLCLVSTTSTSSESPAADTTGGKAKKSRSSASSDAIGPASAPGANGGVVKKKRKKKPRPVREPTLEELERMEKFKRLMREGRATAEDGASGTSVSTDGDGMVTDVHSLSEEPPPPAASSTLPTTAATPVAPDDVCAALTEVIASVDPDRLERMQINASQCKPRIDASQCQPMPANVDQSTQTPSHMSESTRPSRYRSRTKLTASELNCRSLLKQFGELKEKIENLETQLSLEKRKNETLEEILRKCPPPITSHPTIANVQGRIATQHLERQLEYEKKKNEMLEASLSQLATKNDNVATDPAMKN